MRERHAWMLLCLALTACGGGGGRSNGPTPPPPPPPPDPGDGGLTAVELPLPVNDMVWDRWHGVIYLTVPSAVGPEGNVILAIDPVSGATLRSQFAGSEPDKLAISDDGQFLYAGIDGAARVRRFHLPDLTQDIDLSLGVDGIYGPRFAVDLQVAPGEPRTIAVSRGNLQVLPRSQGGIAIFDDAVPRPVIAPGGFPLYDSLQWGSTPAELYAANGEDSGFDFYTLAVDSDGVRQTHDYPRTFGGYDTRIHFDAGTGLIYGNDGRAISPANGQRVGQFPVEGPMVPDAASNTATFLPDGSGYQLKTFDQTRFTPTGSIPIAGPMHGYINRLIRWGGTGYMALDALSRHVFLIGGNGSAVSPPLPDVPTGEATHTTQPLLANAMVWDATHGLIYASVPGRAGADGNSIAAIDPTTGRIVSSTFVGSEPHALAISGDDQFLYVGLDGSSSIQRLRLPALTPELTIALGSDPMDGPYHALDMQVAPGAPRTLAVTLAVDYSEPAARGGIRIYDDAMARPDQATDYRDLYDSLQWGSDASELFAATNESSSFEFYVFSVDASGLHGPRRHASIFRDYGARIHFDRTTGVVYSDDGSTARPADGLPVGQFGADGLMVPDPGLDTAFFVAFRITGTTLESYDLSRFRPIARIRLDQLNGELHHFIRWGSNGLAFLDYDKLHLVSGSLVSSAPVTHPASAKAGPRRLHR